MVSTLQGAASIKGFLNGNAAIKDAVLLTDCNAKMSRHPGGLVPHCASECACEVAVLKIRSAGRGGGERSWSSIEGARQCRTDVEYPVLHPNFLALIPEPSRHQPHRLAVDLRLEQVAPNQRRAVTSVPTRRANDGVSDPVCFDDVRDLGGARCDLVRLRGSRGSLAVCGCSRCAANRRSSSRTVRVGPPWRRIRGGLFIGLARGCATERTVSDFLSLSFARHERTRVNKRTKSGSLLIGAALSTTAYTRRRHR